jgi:rhodanese-related sulfurtransferase
MSVSRGFRILVDEALKEIITYNITQVVARQRPDRRDPRLQLVDIRDVRELEREGTIPGALHAPRGMLEFWVDPESPYFKSAFADESKEFVLFCGGGWRSALAAKTLQDMGMQQVAHMDGGFAAWKSAGAPIISYQEHKLESAKRASQHAQD